MKGGEKMKKTLKRGFTMIELLIVIAVLGILAVAVLSAINPIEQINRSRDTGSRSDAEQLLGAIDRFYTGSGYYPWSSGPAISQPLTWSNTKSLTGVLDNLSNATGELKASFMTRIQSTTPNYNSLYLVNMGAQGDSTYACFAPQSYQFLNDAQKRCGATIPDDFDSTNICNGASSYSCLP